MTTLQELRRTISHYVDGRRKRRQLQRELAQLAAMGSLDGALADLGVARSQIDLLMAGCAGSSEQLDKMFARLGIDAAQLPIESQREMTLTCTACHDKRRCRKWLSVAGETESAAFCPNAALLDDALMQQHPDRVAAIAEWRRSHPAVAEGSDASDFCLHADELRQMRVEARRREVRALLDVAH
jgi:hypothetical protein